MLTHKSHNRGYTGSVLIGLFGFVTKDTGSIVSCILGYQHLLHRPSNKHIRQILNSTRICLYLCLVYT